MKKTLVWLLLLVTAMPVNAQYSPLPPLGIQSDIPLAGSKGSKVWNMGKQRAVRTKAYDGRFPENKDATRFLEKAVSENNVENAKKFLQAGASAFITYDMIDKKQYDMIDAMYQDNPKLIRFSQLLHHACAKSDPEMIDFLIERGASLDLYGYYVKYVSSYKSYEVMCEWNSDSKYQYTPADVALLYGKKANLKHLWTKYKKDPTIYGINYKLILLVKGSPEYLSEARTVLNMYAGNYSTADIINLGHYYLNHNGSVGTLNCEFLINATVERIAKERISKSGKDADFVDFLNLLLEKGADINAQSDNGAYARYVQSFGINVTSYVNKTPMYVAVTNPNMLDIVKLLRSKGASMTTTANGKKVSVAKLPKVLDEYKEYFMLEGIQ